MVPRATPSPVTAAQSLREWPRSRGLLTASSSSAEKTSRSATTPSAPARGKSVAATAAPNWSDSALPMTRPTAPSRPAPAPGEDGAEQDWAEEDWAEEDGAEEDGAEEDGAEEDGPGEERPVPGPRLLSPEFMSTRYDRRVGQ
jgi:hypothetical protein